MGFHRMSITLQNQLPTKPGPTDAYSATREQDHLNTTEEIFNLLSQLMAVLDRYPPTAITDANGNVLNALAQPEGNDPSSNALTPPDPSQAWIPVWNAGDTSITWLGPVPTDGSSYVAIADATGTWSLLADGDCTGS